MALIQWRCQLKILGGARYFDFKRATVFSLGHFSRSTKRQDMLEFFWWAGSFRSSRAYAYALVVCSPASGLSTDYCF